jgi:hypothetical protein
MKRLLAVAVLVLAGTIGNAHAAVITFEDLPVDAPGTAGGDRISGGFLFDTLLDHSHLDDGTFWGTSNGTTIMVIDAFGAPNNVTFSPIGGGSFSVTAIDLSKANTFSTTSAESVQVTGNLAGGGTVSTTFALAPDFNFATFAFDSSFTNLLSVVLSGSGSSCCGQQPGNYFAIDNIVVETAAVPEPAALTLFALGSAYLIARRRRNHR